MNGMILKSLNPADYSIKSETILVNLGSKSDVKLQFCSFNGADNKFGAFIKSVSLANNPSITTDPINLPIIHP